MSTQSASRKPQKRRVVVHQCSKEELLDRISMVLFGNGHPEDGLAFLTRSFIKDHKDMQSDIKEIKSKVELAIDGAKKANNAIDSYKKEMENIEKGEGRVKKEIGETKHEKRERMKSSVMIISVIIAAMGMVFTAYIGIENRQSAKRTELSTKRTEVMVDELGAPVVVNPRGEFSALPEGYNIKMWPKDFDETVVDSVK